MRGAFTWGYVQKLWHKIVTLCMHWSCKHEMRNRFGLMNTQQELTFLLTDESWKIFANVLYLSWLLNSQEEQGWHSAEDTRLSSVLPRFKSRPGYLICGLSLLLVLSLVLRGFSQFSPPSSYPLFVCTTVSNSPSTLLAFISGYGNTENVFC